MFYDSSSGRRTAGVHAGQPGGRRGRAIGRRGGAHREAQEQARLSDTRVANQHEDKEIVICVSEARGGLSMTGVRVASVRAARAAAAADTRTATGFDSSAQWAAHNPVSSGVSSSPVDAANGARAHGVSVRSGCDGRGARARHRQSRRRAVRSALAAGAVAAYIRPPNPSPHLSREGGGVP